MMNYRVSHLTEYAYAEPVVISHNALYLRPRADRPGQLCGRSQVRVEPVPADFRHERDYFGNQVAFFTIQEDHDSLVIRSECEVTVSPAATIDPAATPPWESVRGALRAEGDATRFDAYQFAFDSPFVPTSPDVEEFARASFPPERPVLEAALDLTARIHREFRYEKRSTEISTPLLEVLHQRRGVCQDFAHLEIACLRSVGLAARYVSGYLLTAPPPGKEKLRGADASHAWLALWCGRSGWIDLDPTNNRIPSDQHITIAWGRDFGDVSPVKGVILGGGEHEVRVAVDVTEAG